MPSFRVPGAPSEKFVLADPSARCVFTQLGSKALVLADLEHVGFLFEERSLGAPESLRVLGPGAWCRYGVAWSGR